MAPEQNMDRLDAKLSEEGIALAKLKSNLAENKQASEELKESLENLETVTKKIEENKG
jgi:predicted  nucleic acid-binding Zn-ribbon protein